MSKSKKEAPKNPGFESTIWIDESHILESAAAFGDVAIELAKSLSPYSDPRLNVVFTNGALALELYFKAQVVERVFDPAYFEITPDGNQRPATEKQYIEQTKPSVVSILHSRLQVPKKYRTHELVELFVNLSDEIQDKIVGFISGSVPKIKSKKDMVEFLGLINCFFVDKRYEFEGFISGVEADKIHIYTLIPLLQAMKESMLGKR
ncbi:hypothetical protein ACL9RJ_29105 [Pseudomonas sp. Mn2068]|uniref:hypothetical protein n=1 Tax=Pseudomonas sp. Mn2068 TaxID=3395265 RepID=UPI003BEE8B42